MKFKISYADEIVGLLTCIALVGVIALVFVLGTNQNWFTRKYYYKTEFETAGNISVEMPVKYKGFSIGKIKKISLVDDKVVASFYILERYHQYVREGSVVEVQVSPIGLGNSFIFYPGKESKLLTAGSFIFRADTPVGRQLIADGKSSFVRPNDSIGALISQISDILVTVNGILAGTSDAPATKVIDNLNEITAHVSKLSSRLENPKGMIPTMLGYDDKTQLYKEIDTTIALVQDELEQVKQVTLNAQNVVLQTGGIASQANTILANSKPQIDTALNQINALLLQIQDVMEGIKNNPLIKSGVPSKVEAAPATPLLRSSGF